MPTTKITIDIVKLLAVLPEIQKFIKDVIDPSLTPEGRTKVIGEFTKKLLISTEAVIHTDLLDDTLFNELVDSLIILVIAGMDSYDKLQALIASLPKP